MLYIFKKTIPDSKNVLYALTFLYGINLYQSKKICQHIGINPQITVKQLKTNHVNLLVKYINKNIKVEQLLKKTKKDQKQFLIRIKTVRGIRSNQNLPVRGQRTHTNAKTVKKMGKIKNNFGKEPFKTKKRKTVKKKIIKKKK